MTPSLSRFANIFFTIQILQLVDRCHVYALDMRGHGRSTNPKDSGWLQSTWTHLASDVIAVVEALSIHGTDLINASLATN
jgi:pimeloyl-ACP methyl ester carboxylesterase